MRILVAGLGSIGQRHVRNLHQLLGTEVEILAYRERGRSHVLNEMLAIVSHANVETEYNKIRSYTRLDEALAEAPTATLVCNPTSRHMSVALAAARAGSHLFIEKPLSDSWEGVDELMALVEQKGLVSLVGYQFRFHPCIAFLERCLRENRIGRVLTGRIMVGEYLPSWHPYEDYRESYAARRDLGGGAILTMSHEFDWLYHIFGRPRRLWATGGHVSKLDVDVEDIANILLEFRTATAITPVHVHLDYLQSPPARRCEFVGDEGKIEIDLVAGLGRLVNSAAETVESVTLDDFQRNTMFLDELSHFLTCVKTGSKTIVPVREGAESLRIALAARQSLETGQIVEVK